LGFNSGRISVSKEEGGHPENRGHLARGGLKKSRGTSENIKVTKISLSEWGEQKGDPCIWQSPLLRPPPRFKAPPDVHPPENPFNEDVGKVANNLWEAAEG